MTEFLQGHEKYQSKYVDHVLSFDTGKYFLKKKISGLSKDIKALSNSQLWVFHPFFQRSMAECTSAGCLIAINSSEKTIGGARYYSADDGLCLTPI